MKITRWTAAILSVWMMIASLTACGSDTPADPSTSDSSETAIITDPVTEIVSELESDSEVESEIDTESTHTPWIPDMGTFNEGKVIYHTVVETEAGALYPTDRIGTPMFPHEDGVKTLFYTDFSDGDATVSGNALSRAPELVQVIDGKLYQPSEADSACQFIQSMNTWGPSTQASVKDYRQVQFSFTWDTTPSADVAWLSGMVGCYTSNSAIPDVPGNGLWFSFRETANLLTVFHPDVASWPAGWADIPVESGMMEGLYRVDIIGTEDYTTYVYITAEGTTEAKPVATIRFADGKIRVFDGNGGLIKEDACTTNALTGENFSLFAHLSGMVVDEVGIYAGNRENRTTTTITATPTEGNSLGLDITDRTDLVSICYSTWFNAILGNGTEPVTSYPTVSEILAGRQEWGGVNNFHYWAKPAEGYYRSSDKAVIRKHMSQLYAAGVDFIILDNTFYGYGDENNAVWDLYTGIPVTAICDTIMEMRAEGLGTPYVVFWISINGGEPLFRAVYDRFYNVEKWRDCFVYWHDKPFILTYGDVADCPADLMTVRTMRGLSGVDESKNDWSFLTINSYGRYAKGPDGQPEQVSVAVAAQETYMSAPTAHGRKGGSYWFKQWYNAFTIRPKIVTLTWWNEWAAQRIEVSPGVFHFTDNYNQEYSRDIEPMEGGHGDQYYRWLIEYIAAYKGGLECPILVEDSYRNAVDRWLKNPQ